MSKEVHAGEIRNTLPIDQQEIPAGVEVITKPRVIRTVRRPSRETTGRRVLPSGTTEQGGRPLAIEYGFAQALVEGRMGPTVERQGGRDEWTKGIYNSDIISYHYSFTEVLDGKSITDIIRNRNGALVVDLMAPSGTLADLFLEFPSDAQRRGIAVSLTDERNQKEKDRDRFLGIDQIAGDLTRAKTWQELEKEMKGRKADLIMERGFAALGFLPAHPQFYRYVMKRLWNMVSEDGGTLLLELPEEHIIGMDLSQWQNILRGQGMDVSITLNALRMVRRPDSPLELPSI